jgi:hypothetical protein
LTGSCQPSRVPGPNAEQTRNGAHIISIWSVVTIELRFGEHVHNGGSASGYHGDSLSR